MSASTSVRPGPWRATGHAVVHLLSSIVALVLFVIEIVAIALVPITVGALTLFVVVPMVGSFASWHRVLAARYLDRPIEPAPYKPTKGMSLLRRLGRWASDSARWRDLLWLLLDFVIGFTLTLTVVTMFLAILWYLIYPFLFWVTPQGVFDMNLGVYQINTQQRSFQAWVFALVAALLWLGLSGPLMRLKVSVDRVLLSSTRTEVLERRVQQISDSRAESVDFSAAELRRIERDLHDGAQARMVALGMSLGMADELIESDPEAARRLLTEARLSSSAALGDLRSVVRGIHPPVLADRGLAGAVQALAMDMAVPMAVTVLLAGRPPAPVESAAYFAIAECLANIGKHSGATRAWITMGHNDEILRVEVGDDGRGGADPAAGTGMLGVMRRLSAFDGTMGVSSPVGGPTLIVLEVPCALSSAKITPFSAMD